jgi:hypothetical protein
MSWSDEEFCERVVRRCGELGRSQRAVLKEAQCAHDYLQTNPQHGRRIDRIVRIAEVLDTPLSSLLGLSVNGTVDTDILLIAYRAAREATQQVQQLDEAIFVQTMAQIYNVLMSRRADGHDPHDPDYLKLAIEVVRTGVTTRRPT